MGKQIRLSLQLGALILLAACATSYGPKGMMGGYSEKQIDETTIQVFFEGNQHTTKEQVRTNLMFRCAELTIENGFSHFMIISDDSYEHDGTFDMTYDQPGKTTESLSRGTLTTVDASVQVEPISTNIVGVFTIQMMPKVDSVYASASINAQDFYVKNQHLIKWKK
ncbi:MAG: hypothetical protein HQ507_11120 [Candidatus Marinimicrobia bacterium]|nr:hypothetical protein [Candidatus Neomarinimicrobiota bacterium]